MGFKKHTNHNPSPGTRIKPGQRLPGAGRPFNTPAQNAIKTFTREALAEIINELTGTDRRTLKNMYMMLPPYERINGVKALIARSIYWGDMGELEKILARAIGPLPQRMEMTGAEGTPLIPTVIKIEPIKSLTKP